MHMNAGVSSEKEKVKESQSRSVTLPLDIHFGCRVGGVTSHVATEPSSSVRTGHVATEPSSSGAQQLSSNRPCSKSWQSGRAGLTVGWAKTGDFSGQNLSSPASPKNWAGMAK